MAAAFLCGARPMGVARESRRSKAASAFAARMHETAKCPSIAGGRSMTIQGFVRDGKIIPAAPLPEGASVRITLDVDTAVDAELQEELADWQMLGAQSLEMVERLADEEGGDHEKR